MQGCCLLIQRLMVQILVGQTKINRVSKSSRNCKSFTLVYHYTHVLTHLPVRLTDDTINMSNLSLSPKDKSFIETSEMFSQTKNHPDSILRCPPDDEFTDAAEEYLAEQYDSRVLLRCTRIRTG